MYEFIVRMAAGCLMGKDVGRMGWEAMGWDGRWPTSARTVNGEGIDNCHDRKQLHVSATHLTLHIHFLFHISTQGTVLVPMPHPIHPTSTHLYKHPSIPQAELSSIHVCQLCAFYLPSSSSSSPPPPSPMPASSSLGACVLYVPRKPAGGLSRFLTLFRSAR